MLMSELQGAIVEARAWSAGVVVGTPHSIRLTSAHQQQGEWPQEQLQPRFSWPQRWCVQSVTRALHVLVTHHAPGLAPAHLHTSICLAHLHNTVNALSHTQPLAPHTVLQASAPLVAPAPAHADSNHLEYQAANHPHASLPSPLTA